MVNLRKKKPDSLVQDFRKIQSKVGKVRRKSLSLTNTNFKTKKLLLRNSSPNVGEVGMGILVSSRKLSLSQLLARCDHHNVSNRNDSLMQINQIITTGEIPDIIRLQLLKRLSSTMLVDPSQKVRKSLSTVIKTLIMLNNELDDENANFLLLHLRSALSHIRRDVRTDALAMIHFIVTRRGLHGCKCMNRIAQGVLKLVYDHFDTDRILFDNCMAVLEAIARFHMIESRSKRSDPSVDNILLSSSSNERTLILPDLLRIWKSLKESSIRNSTGKALLAVLENEGGCVDVNDLSTLLNCQLSLLSGNNIEEVILFVLRNLSDWKRSRKVEPAVLDLVIRLLTIAEMELVLSQSLQNILESLITLYTTFPSTRECLLPVISRFVFRLPGCHAWFEELPRYWNTAKNPLILSVISKALKIRYSSLLESEVKQWISVEEAPSEYVAMVASFRVWDKSTLQLLVPYLTVGTGLRFSLLWGVVRALNYSLDTSVLQSSVFLSLVLTLLVRGDCSTGYMISFVLNNFLEPSDEDVLVTVLLPKLVNLYKENLTSNLLEVGIWICKHSNSSNGANFFCDFILTMPHHKQFIMDLCQSSSYTLERLVCLASSNCIYRNLLIEYTNSAKSYSP